MAKAKHLEAWGRSTARSRYGDLRAGDKGGTAPQAPQFAEDQHAAKYDNDVGVEWTRGMPTAESKPHFDKSKGKR